MAALICRNWTAGGRKPIRLTSAGHWVTARSMATIPLGCVEAEALYDLLEREVIPEFYQRDKDGIPTAWVARMQESMARLTPRFSASRAVRDYTEQHYLPAATAYRERSADKGAVGRQLVDWGHRLEQHWSRVRFGEVTVESDVNQHVFDVHVSLGKIDPKSVQIELYADGVNDGGPIRQEMTRVRQPAGTAGDYLYRATVSATRPATDYTARVIPCGSVVAVPLEAAYILWQR